MDRFGVGRGGNGFEGERDPGQDGLKGGGQGGIEGEGEGEGEVWESRSIDGGEAWWSRDQTLCTGTGKERQARMELGKVR